MYYNASDEVDARRWQRLRDLLEADSLLRTKYPVPKLVGGVWRESITAAQGVVLSITPTGDAFGNDAPTTHHVRQGMTIVVQTFVDMKANGTDPTTALTTLMNVTTAAREALLRYRSERDPIEAVRLWDEIAFPAARVTDYFPVPNANQWASFTHFELYDYQRNR